MNIVPAGVPALFVTSSNSSSLNIGLSIYQLVEDEMELVHGPTAMENFVGDAYRGQYTPDAGKTYVAFIAVYSDSSLTSILPDYEQQAESFYAEYQNQQVQDLLGMIDCGDQVVPSPTFKVFLGDAKTMYLRVVDEAFKPLDLSGCTEIVVNLLNADGTTTQLKLSEEDVLITSPSVLGQFSAVLSSEVSAILNVGVFQTFDVTLTISEQVFTVPFVQGISVFEVS